MEEIQIGLNLKTSTLKVGNVEYQRRELISNDGYCFYDKRVEIYDEEGNVIPTDEVQANQRVYMRYAILGLADSVDNYVSVSIEEYYEIV